MKIIEFIKKDYYNEAGYKLSFIIKITGVLGYLAVFYFLSHLIGNSAGQYLRDYDYFSFVFLGIVFSNYLFTILSMFSEQVRNEQMTGTLEMVFSAPLSSLEYVLYSNAWKWIVLTFETLIYLLAGIVIFKGIYFNVNILSLIFVLVLSITAFAGLGILSAAFIFVFKRGDPVNFVLSSVFALLGGVFFPVQVFPTWLKNISMLLPITHSLDGIRAAIITGKPVNELFAKNTLYLLLFSVIILPLSLLVFKKALDISKKLGNIGKY